MGRAGDQVPALRHRLPILAAEGDDGHLRLRTRQPGHPIAPEPGAGDEAANGEGAGGGFESQLGGVFVDGQQARAGDDLGAPLPGVAGEAPGDGGKIGQRRLRNQKGTEAPHVRLELRQALGADPLEPDETVGLAAATEVVEPWKLFRAGGDDELAASSPGQVVGGGVACQGFAAGHRQPRLGGAGAVVEARVDDAAVSAALVAGEVVLGFEEQHPASADALQGQATGDRGADDAAADDGHRDRLHPTGPLRAPGGCASRARPARHG